MCRQESEIEFERRRRLPAADEVLTNVLEGERILPWLSDIRECAGDVYHDLTYHS